MRGWVDVGVGGSRGMHFCSVIFNIILLGKNFLDYLNRIIIKLFLAHLKDLNGHLCLIHKINRHTYKIHIYTQTKTI